MSGGTVNFEEWNELADDIERIGQDEERLLSAGERGALEAFDTSGVPSRSGELAASKFVRRSGSELEAGFDSTHYSRGYQRDAIAPDVDAMADAAGVAMEDEVDRLMTEANL